MVRINAEGAYARRRALVDDLPRRVLALLRRFIDARLLVTDRDPQGRETSEIAHEALLRTWPQLSGWLMEDMDKLRLLESLIRAAEEWDQGGRRDDLLVHRDGRLKDALALAGNSRFSMPEASVERAYLTACSEAQRVRDAAAKEEQERRIHDAEQIAEQQKKAAEAQKRIAEKQKTITRGLLLGSLAILAMLVIAGWQWQDAKDANHKVGEVQQLARHTSDIGMKPQQSFLLGVQAASLSKDGRQGTLTAIDGLRAQLHTTGGRPLHGHEMATRTAAFSPDRRWLATGSDEGAIRLWDLSPADPTSRGLALDGHKGPVHGLAFSADGRWLVSGAEDGTVRLLAFDGGRGKARPRVRRRPVWSHKLPGARPERQLARLRYGERQHLHLEDVRRRAAGRRLRGVEG